MAASTRHGAFGIDLPEGWEDRTIYTFTGPDDSGFQHFLTLVIDDSVGDMELSEFARDRIAATTASLAGIEVLKDEAKTLPNGKTVHEFVYQWIPAEGKVILRKEVYLVADGVGYTFSGNFSRKTIKTVGLEADQIINSFRPEGDQPED